MNLFLPALLTGVRYVARLILKGKEGMYITCAVDVLPTPF